MAQFVTTHYANLGGINEKSSQYSTQRTQFLSIRNLDFNTPNALEKRPGSTRAISSNYSGTILSLYEFAKFDGFSMMLVGTGTELFRMNYGSGLSSLILGYTGTQPVYLSSAQPPDMLTFNNKAWIANGNKFYKYNFSQAYLFIKPPDNPTGCFTVSPTSGQSFFFGVSSPVFVWAGAAPVLNYFTGPSNNPYVFGPMRVIGYQYHTTTVRSNLSFSAIAMYGSQQLIDYGISTLQFFYYITYCPSTKAAVQTIINNPPSDNQWRIYSEDGNPVPMPGTKWLTNYQPNWNDATFAQFPAIGASIPVIPQNSTGPYFDIPKYIEVNNNVMFFGGYSSSPSTLVHSEILEPEQIQPENQFEVRTNDGDRVTALKAFNSQLMIFKTNSFFKLLGDNPDNFELVTLSQEYGCLSNKCIVQFKTRLMWLDQQGIVEYNGADWNIKSQPVEQTFRRMNVTAAKENAVGVHYPLRNQIWFGIPIDGSSQNNVTVVYDYLVDAWTVFSGFNPSAFFFGQSALSAKTIFRGDYSGMIYYHGPSFFSDNGTGFTCSFLTSFEEPDSPNVTNLWRRFFLDTRTETGVTGVLNAKIYANFDQSTAQTTFAMYQASFQSRADFGVVAKSAAAEISHNNVTLPLLINGYSWSRRNLRGV